MTLTTPGSAHLCSDGTHRGAGYSWGIAPGRAIQVNVSMAPGKMEVDTHTAWTEWMGAWVRGRVGE